MEHKLYKNIRRIKLPFLIRLTLGFFLIISWIISIILPLPLSVPTWIILIVIWIIFVIEARDIKELIKIRKGIFYLSKNFKNKQIRKHKIKDIKKHTRLIIKKKKCSKKQ